MSTKEKVLSLLKNTENILSGEKIAVKLQISRTAVWKAIKELEKNGHSFEHLPTGYRYLSTERLQAEQLKKGLPFIPEIFVSDTVESTMKTAKLAALDANCVTPALYLAEKQTAGHGRFQRPFFSPNGKGIYMSLLLRPNQLFEQLPQYTLLAAVATAAAIDEVTGEETAIKWVNDIFLNGKKVCGILSEATSDFESGRIASIIIGIGLNFSIPQSEFPEELQQKAASIFPNGSPSVSRQQLIEKIWQNFFELLTALPATDYLKLYRKKSFVLGKIVRFQQQGKNYEGLATDITDAGELVVQSVDKQFRLASGEISLESDY